MKVVYLKEYKDLEVNIRNLSLVLGYFDGVHIGHSQLISFARGISEENPLGVLTFDKSLKSIDNSLSDLNSKIENIKKLNVDYLFIVVTDENFKKMSYVNFVNKFLKILNPSKIFCGPDFKYGNNAVGDVQFLKERFSDVYVLNYVKDHKGNKISSSSIKELIRSGDIKNANRWLGREFSIIGKVEHGKNNGKLLGYPTANIDVFNNYVVPQVGVYITKTKIDENIYPSVTNIGTHPTINQLDKVLIETHIIGLDDDLYNKTIEIRFVDRIRGEYKFKSLEELKNRIKEDVNESKHYFRFDKFR